MGYMMDPTVTIPGPAPKEEDMEFAKTTCAGCGATLLNLETCQRCAERTTERRALARDAYMAALGGLCAGGNLNVTDTAGGAAVIALETVRRWDAFLAAVDAEGGE